MALPNPETRQEMFLAAAAGESVTLPDPVTHKEVFLAKAAGMSVAEIEPVTREEMYLNAITGGGGGGEITKEALSVNSNGTYTAPSGKAYSPVTVNVPNTYAAGDEGKVVSNGALVSQTAHAKVTSNGTIDTTLNNSVEVDVPVSGPQWTLIGESTHALPEYTDTTAAEATTDTGINVQNTNFCWLLVVVICDTPIETSTEWGMTVAMLGTTKTGLIYAPSSLNTYWEKGSATLSRSALANTVQYNGNNIGLFFQPSNNSATVKFSRKANNGYCPKLRAGNYTVKVYGLSSL